jgi:transcriptional regulator with XRE-family HTH domain
MDDEDGFRLGGYPLSGLIRRVRRSADLSQRELARSANISPSSIADFETGAKTPRLDTLQRILNAANFQLVVVDVQGRLVTPLEVWQDVADGAGRRYPAHLDTILDPVFGEWWADTYALARPPETFRRSRIYRDAQRRRSQWEVRVAQFRFDPPPRRPEDLPEPLHWRDDESA